MTPPPTYFCWVDVVIGPFIWPLGLERVLLLYIYNVLLYDSLVYNSSRALSSSLPTLSLSSPMSQVCVCVNG
jgi:hypothetical protein